MRSSRERGLIRSGLIFWAGGIALTGGIFVGALLQASPRLAGIVFGGVSVVTLM